MLLVSSIKTSQERLVTVETIQDVMEMWTYSSPSLKKALLLGFAELIEKGAAPPWMLFLADDYGLIDLTQLNDNHTAH